ncbi:protein of unknown function (DUF1985) [Abeliophyllum distichum]|uniref:Uncharacterized protein n=1 Tax=Abeliophyllum distichum TaxID=126358 RepID=A0ABD1TI78_9LAMI
MDRKKINIETLSLVDDLEVCYDYPWGQLSFSTLLWSLLTAVKSTTDRGSKIRQYTIYGFPMIFQMWIYEVCPQIGERFAEKLQTTYPRILNWDAHHQVHRTTILEFLNSTEVVLLPILQPREEEVEQPYVYSLCVPDDAVDVRVDALVHEFVYGGQEYGGDEEDDGEEQGGQEFGGGEEDDGQEQGGQEYGGGEEDDGEEQEEIQGEMEQQIGEEREEGMKNM